MAFGLSRFAKRVDPLRLFTNYNSDHDSVNSDSNMSTRATRGGRRTGSETPSTSSRSDGRSSSITETPSTSSRSDGRSSSGDGVSAPATNGSNISSIGDEAGFDRFDTASADDGAATMPTLPPVLDAAAFTDLQMKYDEMRRGRDEMRNRLLQMAEDRKMSDKHSTICINGRRPQYVGELHQLRNHHAYRRGIIHE